MELTRALSLPLEKSMVKTESRLTDGHQVPYIHCGGEARVQGRDGADDSVILYVRAVPNLDAVAITTDDSAVPDGHFVPERHFSNDRCRGGDESVARDPRTLVK